jgi:hypothetical protein
VLERNFQGFRHGNIPADQVFSVGIPLYLPSNVSQSHGLEMDIGSERRDRDGRRTTRKMP